MNAADASIRETILLRSEIVAENTMAFHFSKPPGFRHRAGQSLSMTLAGPLETGGGSHTRAFTIASAPHEIELMVATRMRDSAFKRALKTAPPGTAAMLEGPAGDMTLHEDAARPAVFLAGGIGITPFLSMLRHATHERLPHRLRLFYANARPEDAAFLDELEETQYLNPNYRLIATMIEPERSIDSWWGETGLIGRGMLERHLAGFLDPVYYVAGPAPMTLTMRQMLQAMGVDERDVRCETFHGYCSGADHDEGTTVKNWSEIRAWRRERREELIAARAAVASAQRDAWNERITALLAAGFNWPSGTVIGFCWPHKGEFDARFAVRRWRDGGVIAALPEVVERTRPLRFSEWWPGAPMKPGVYDIPVPDGTRTLLPDVAIVPMNGFDDGGYRLGYGGGYFDRTLAALGRKVLAIGVSFEALHLATIHPQPHDIPMDFVVTETAIFRAGGTDLTPLDPAACLSESGRLLKDRGLPRGRPAEPENPPKKAPAMTPKETHALLNALLEAARAGAKALAAFLDDYEPGTPAWMQLAAIQRDEAGNCAILLGLIHGNGGTPSAATGDFAEKALAVQGPVARLRFLNRGQQWVVRRLDEALPRLSPGPVRDSLLTMRESHLLNIGACEVLLISQKT